MLASRTGASPPIFERYIFRPFGALAIVGSGVLLVGVISLSVQYLNAEPVAEIPYRPPTLNLSVAGDFQQAIHFEYMRDRGRIYERHSFVAPLNVLPVSPNEWMKISTTSPLGLPHSARMRIYRSARPKPCYGHVMIGCIDVDTESRSESISLFPQVAAGFGFMSPSEPGSYWIALNADWGLGGGTQVFVIDVRG
jgi:hypothetical protein